MTGSCIHCGEPFSAKNVFTQAGWRETRISGYCEACFDLLFAETDNPDDAYEPGDPKRSDFLDRYEPED